MPDAREAFVEIARDLLSLEINTVLKDGMSARKMPDACNALIDLAQEYHVFLCEQARLFADIGTSLPGWAQALSDSFDWGAEPFPRPVPGKREPFTAQHQRSTEEGTTPGIPWALSDYLREYPKHVQALDFKKLREIASWLREMRDRTRTLRRHGGFWPELKLADNQVQLSETEVRAVEQVVLGFGREEDSVLYRIQRTCDVLAGVTERIAPSAGSAPATLQRGFPGRASSDDALILRKAWDIGTETVVMQTVLQIDGDSITRLQPGRDAPGQAGLHQLHNGAVQVSLKHWRTLADTVAAMAGASFSAIFQRGAG